MNTFIWTIAILQGMSALGAALLAGGGGKFKSSNDYVLQMLMDAAVCVWAIVLLARA